MHQIDSLLPHLTLDPRGLLPLGMPALVGVSGGRDSVALLHALVQGGGAGLVVCHFDHGWRVESAGEAAWVAKLAAKTVLPLEQGQELAPTDRLHSETTARAVRYRFFAEVAARRGCTQLYLAHHADDQVETFFFNLLRGAGGTGLCGMHPVSKQIIDGTPLTIHRPLLGTWRAEIDRYVAAHGLQFCEDASNAETQHTRNRLRHEVLPMIEEALGRRVREPLWRAAEIAAAEDALLAGQTPPFPPGDVSVASILALPLALQRRALNAWLRASGVPHVSFDDVEIVLRLCTQIHPAKVNLSAGWHARRRSGQIFLKSPF